MAPDQAPETPAAGDRIDALTSGAETLAESMDELSKSVLALAARDAFKQRVLVALGAMVVVMTGTIVFLIVAMVGVSDANHAIKDSLAQNYTTQQQQAQTRVKVLCPLYTLLLAGQVSPAAEAAMSPVQRLQYENTVKVVKSGYTTLGCLPALPATK